jgi:cap2 methyltransferase
MDKDEDFSIFQDNVIAKNKEKINDIKKEEIPEKKKVAKESKQEMLIFDISFKNQLPPESHWLTPIYAGEGDTTFKVLTKLDSPSVPQKWKTEFPLFAQQIPEFYNLKEKLNKVKQKIDKIFDDPQTYKKYEIITDVIRLHDDLRTKNGKLVNEYNAEIATNAWMKMYELCTLLDPVFKKYTPAKNQTEKILNSFHIAEAPGTFILAINHYLANHFPSLNWKWLANSYRDLYFNKKLSNTHYLQDSYGLIKKYYDNWVFGADGDGDITSPANIASFKLAIQKKLGSIQLITSDVKFVQQKINFNEEERYNIPVHMGHLLCSLELLEKGGTMILKEFTFFEQSSLSLLYLASYCFDQLLLVKPETSRAANSEVYIIGIDYKKNLTPIQFAHLYKVLNYIRTLNTDEGSPSLFTKKDIPKEFLDKVYNATKKICEYQTVQIERNLRLFEECKDTPIQEIRKNMTTIRAKTANEWIYRVKIQPLSESRKIGNVKDDF